MAAKATIAASVWSLNRPKKKRPGIHSKKKTSRVKSSKNYKKTYKGQGK